MGSTSTLERFPGKPPGAEEYEQSKKRHDVITLL